MSTMRAAVFVEPGKIELQQRPIPDIGPTDALLRVTTTTICGTDVHILKGEYPVRPGLIVGHEPVGIIEKLGSAVTGYEIGQRVIAGAITPCGQCHPCLDGHSSQCGGQAMGGWQLGTCKVGQTIEVRVYTSIRYLVRYDLGDVYMCCYLLVLLKILCSLNLSMHPCSHAPN